jgi:hypothetical protein
VTKTVLSSDFYNALYVGRIYPDKPRLDPFGDWTAFQAALAAYSSTSTLSFRQSRASTAIRCDWPARSRGWRADGRR